MPQYKRKLSKGYRWYYKFTYKGKTYHSKAKYFTRQETKKAENSRYDNLETELRQIENDITLITLINERLDYLQTAKSDKYYKENRYYLNQLYENLGDVSVSEISKGDINKILISLSREKQDENRDNYAVNAMLRAVKAMFFYGIKYCNLTISNPCQGIDFFPINKKLKYIPSDQEIKKLIDLCNPEQRSLVEFVRDTGCRISEALNLKHGDVFDEYVVLYTRKSKLGNLMLRKVKYHTQKIAKIEPVERVFNMWNKEPKFLTRKTKGKWSWHNLRHRYASILSKDNTPIFEIMSLLGHSNIETTQKYLQLLP